MSLNADTLKITKEILSLIAEIDEFKGAWTALATLSPDRLTALRRVATIESIGSSTRIEGSKLSDTEVEALLRNINIRHFESRDEQEVAGYAEVMETIFESAAEIALTENHIKQLHRDLLVYSAKDDHHRGEYKTLDNHVSAFDADGNEIGIVFQTASPFDTPGRITELVTWTNETLDQAELHPLLAISIFVVTFLEIHPFQDGNGRLSRALTTLLFLRSGYKYVPYASLESIIEKNKEAYYRALRDTQTTIRSEAPDWQPWLVFFLTSLKRQKTHLAVKIEREKLTLAALDPLSINILELVREHGDLSIGQLTDLSGANRNTMKKRLSELVKNNHLVKRGEGKGTRYGRA